MLSLLRNRCELLFCRQMFLLLPGLWVSNIFCFWNWKNKQAKYVLCCGIRYWKLFLHFLRVCVTWNMLMYWWHCLKLFPVPVWSIKCWFQNIYCFAIHDLGTNFLMYLKLRDDSECFFWICTFDIVSLIYSASCRLDLFCDLSIVLLRHSHGNLSGLPKSKSWWSAISFGNLLLCSVFVYYFNFLWNRGRQSTAIAEARISLKPSRMNLKICIWKKYSLCSLCLEIVYVNWSIILIFEDSKAKM